MANESKKLILDVSMSGELHVLARHLERISEQHRWSRDFTLFSLQEALREVIAYFPVYRTYIRGASNVVNEEDRRYILSAIRTAKRRNPAVSESVFDFIASVLLLKDPEGLGEAEKIERRDFVMRFQQFAGPVMAKGLEDTAFYRTYPLVSLNEVGGNPEQFGLPVEEFHKRNAERLMRWPYAFLATSTHDTKRSEDVRARINLFSEMPGKWERTIQQWRSWNRGKKVELEGAEIPDANEEYLLYQTLVGTWPLQPMDQGAHGQFTKRIERYMEKALREAKLHTSWISPNEAYEQALKSFVRSILAPNPDNRFLPRFLRFQTRIAQFGIWNSLSQTLLKVMSPGVPDFYQGQEDGRIKLYVAYKALDFRRTHYELFLDGDHLPVYASSKREEHVCAFLKRKGVAWALVVASRFFTRLVPKGDPPLGQRVWRERWLILPGDAREKWLNVFTGEAIKAFPSPEGKALRLAEIFSHFPIALFSGAGEEGPEHGRG